jgi:hypothetical protein
MKSSRKKSSPSSRSSKPKKQKIDDDFAKLDDLKQTIEIEEKDINDFLKSRKKLFNLYEDIDSIDSIDCIIIVAKDKISIKDSIIRSSIDGYISKGCYGYIFIGSNATNKYIIKIMPTSDRNIDEINIMKAIMNYNKSNINNVIPNYVYLLSYYLKCNKITNKSNILAKAINDNIIKKTLKGVSTSSSEKKENVSDGTYSILIIEQFDGTIKDLLISIMETDDKINHDNYTPENIILLNSIFAQIILSLYIFHNKFRYYHNDAHLNNFFYKKISPNNKYFHYIINGTNYYIQNCGYLVVLGDFGLAKEITDKSNIQEYHFNLIKDYDKLLKYINYLYIKAITESKFNELINDKENIYELIKIYSTFICFSDITPGRYNMCKTKINDFYDKNDENLENDFLHLMMAFLKIRETVDSKTDVINKIPYTI